ncbi:hypothetical protein HZS_889, partial [Henneguya salminicola]
KSTHWRDFFQINLLNCQKRTVKNIGLKCLRDGMRRLHWPRILSTKQLFLFVICVAANLRRGNN